MVLAVHYAQLGKHKQVSVFLTITLLLGVCFLLIKSYEYYDDVQRHIVINESAPILSMFYLIYYIMTGIHALHVIIGLGVITVLIAQNRRRRFSEAYYTPIELTGLYWHFVDIVWVFIYPSLYLIGRDL